MREEEERGSDEVEESWWEEGKERLWEEREKKRKRIERNCWIGQDDKCVEWMERKGIREEKRREERRRRKHKKKKEFIR